MPAATRTKIEYVPLADLLGTRDERNPKDHDIDGIIASIRTLGFIDPVIRDGRTGSTIAGHGRMEALDAMKAAGEAVPERIATAKREWLVPVTVGWSSKDDDHAAAALIALNRHTERGGWNDGALTALLSNLDGDLLTATGFDQGDLDDLLAALDRAGSPLDATGAKIDPSFGDLRDPYAAKQIRSIILDYPLDMFTWVTETAEKARRSLGVDTNTALYARLLADATGEPLPS